MPIHNNQGRGIKTDGIGSSTTSHLNLTRSMADVWALDSAAKRAEQSEKRRSTYRPRKLGRPPGRIRSPKHAYAGRE